MCLFSNRKSLIGGETEKKQEIMATAEAVPTGIKQEPTEELDIERRLDCCVEKKWG